MGSVYPRFSSPLLLTPGYAFSIIMWAARLTSAPTVLAIVIYLLTKLLTKMTVVLY